MAASRAPGLNMIIEPGQTWVNVQGHRMQCVGGVTHGGICQMIKLQPPNEGVIVHAVARDVLQHWRCLTAAGSELGLRVQVDIELGARDLSVQCKVLGHGYVDEGIEVAGVSIGRSVMRVMVHTPSFVFDEEQQWAKCIAIERAMQMLRESWS